MKLIFSLITLFSLSLPFYACNLEEGSRKAQEIVQEYGHEDPNVLRMCETFLQELREVYDRGEGLISDDLGRIYEAVAFAAKKHEFQVRKGEDETPYIIHPIGVAYHLIHIGHVRDPDIIIGALLHDTVEDTDTSFEEINAQFGPRVEGFVREVTDDKSLPSKERKRLQIVNAPHKSAGAAQIKLADKLYNLSDMLNSPPIGWDRARIQGYFDWAKKVVDALPWVNAPLKKAVDSVIESYNTF